MLHAAVPSWLRAPGDSVTLASGGGHTQRVALCLQDNAPQRSPEARGVPGQTDLGVCRGHASPVGDVLMVPGLRLINPAPRAARTPPSGRASPPSRASPNKFVAVFTFFSSSGPVSYNVLLFLKGPKSSRRPTSTPLP